MHYQDDVPEEVKKSRSQRLLELFRERILEYHKSIIGSKQLILIEGTSKKSLEHLFGRNDANTKVIVPRIQLPDLTAQNTNDSPFHKQSKRMMKPGDYVLVDIIDCTSQTLFGKPNAIYSLQQFTLENVQKSVSTRILSQ